MRVGLSWVVIPAVLAGFITAIAALSSITRAQQIVSVELVVAIDTSTSVDQNEFFLQMQGTADAFRDPEIITLIGKHTGGVAVTLVHWNLPYLNTQAVEWTLLSDPNSVFEFALRVENSSRMSTGNATSIGGAIDYCVRLLEENRFSGLLRKIDISGDGRNNSGPSPEEARARALAKSITINGLSILNGDDRLYRHYEAFVIGGPAAFVITANEFEDFAEAMRIKLLRELAIPVS